MDDDKVMSWWLSEIIKRCDVLAHQIKGIQNRLDRLESSVYIKTKRLQK
jgi:hypothetical protein